MAYDKRGKVIAGYWVSLTPDPVFFTSICPRLPADPVIELDQAASALDDWVPYGNFSASYQSLKCAWDGDEPSAAGVIRNETTTVYTATVTVVFVLNNVRVADAIDIVESVLPGEQVAFKASAYNSGLNRYDQCRVHLISWRAA